MGELSKIHDYKEFVLLAEILALLHDLGKVDDNFEGTLAHVNHVIRLASEMGLRSEKEDRMLQINLSSFTEFAKFLWKNVNVPDGYVNLDEEIGYSALRHHFLTEENDKSSKKKLDDYYVKTLLENIIGQADNIDSGEDRTYIRRYYNNKDAATDFCCNSFGHVFEKTEKNKSMREKFYEKWEERFDELKGKELISKIIKNRDEILHWAYTYWQNAPAMSLYPDPDTSVWDHGYGTASITKAVLNGCLLKSNQFAIFNEVIKNIPFKIKNERLRLPENYKLYVYLVVFESEKISKDFDRELKKLNDQSDDISKEEMFVLKPITIRINGIDKYIFEYKGCRNYSHYMLLKAVYHAKKNEKSNEKKKDNNDKNEYSSLDVNTVKKKFNQFYDIFTIKGSGINYLKIFEANTKSKTCLLDCMIGVPHILSIQYPGRDYRTKVHRVPDYLGREEKLDNLKNTIRKYLEEKIALGNLIYEDVNGMYFLIPDINGVTDENGKNLKETISTNLVEFFDEELNGEIIPYIRFEPCKLTGRTINLGKVISNLNKKYETNIKKRLPYYTLNDLSTIPQWISDWKDKGGKIKKEICHICGKRPVVSEKTDYNQEKACQWCLEVRNRGISGQKKGKEAVFIDQIRDENHKVALLVGDLGLFDLWLSGDYVQTNINIRTDIKDNLEEEHYRSKPPSPSRLRAIVNSTDKFYTAVLRRLEKDYKGVKGTLTFYSREQIKKGFYRISISKADLRTIIAGKSELNDEEEVFIDKLLAGGSKPLGIYVFEDTNDNDDNGYENKAIFTNYIPDIFEEEKLQQILEKAIKKGIFIEDKSNHRLSIDKEKEIKVQISSQDKYNTFREIYTLVDEFMWLVPANKVYQIVKIFEEEFITHFGKAMGRISLNIGSVFFDHKYPLYLVFDAGKRILQEFRESVSIGDNQGKYKIKIRKYKVDASGFKAKVQKITDIGDGKKEVKIRLNNGLLKNKELAYNFDLKLLAYTLAGNNKFTKNVQKIDDKWFVKAISRNQDTYMLKDIGQKFLELKQGDEILFVPNLFEFQLVSSTQERLAIKLEEGQGEYLRRKNPTCLNFRTRPLILEDLNKFNDIYHVLKNNNISNSALYNLQEQIIKYAKETYFTGEIDQDDKKTFRQFVEVLISNISNFKYIALDDKNKFIELIMDGSFFDMMELAFRHRIFDDDKNSI